MRSGAAKSAVVLTKKRRTTPINRFKIIFSMGVYVFLALYMDVYRCLYVLICLYSFVYGCILNCFSVFSLFSSFLYGFLLVVIDSTGVCSMSS